MERKTLEIFVSVNESGDFEAGEDEGDTATALIENYGATQVRTVKLLVEIGLPETTEAFVNVPDDAGTTQPVTAEVAK